MQHYDPIPNDAICPLTGQPIHSLIQLKRPFYLAITHENGKRCYYDGSLFQRKETQTAHYFVLTHLNQFQYLGSEVSNQRLYTKKKEKTWWSYVVCPRALSYSRYYALK